MGILGWGGWDNDHIDAHEQGHENVAKALGCRTRRVNGGRAVQVVSGPPLTPAQHAAIAYGGQARAGGGGHGRDDRLAEQHLKRVPPSERGAARREAKRLARRYA